MWYVCANIVILNFVNICQLVIVYTAEGVWIVSNVISIKRHTLSIYR